MKKKALFTLITLIVCLLGVGCIKNTSENNNALGLPSFSTYQNATESERTIIIEKAAAIPMADAIKYVEEKIAEYVNSKEALDIISLDIYKDDLLMNTRLNQKIFNNLFIDAEFSIDTKDMTREEAENLTREMKSEILDLCFKQDTYGYLKLNTFNFNFIDNNRLLKFGYADTSTIVPAITNLNQAKEELDAQTLVYDFVHEHEHFLLRRFGVVDETKELYIEIPIYTVDTVEEQTHVLEGLNSISDALYHTLGSDTMSKQYIESNNVNTVTISFDVPWHQKEYITYQYTLED